ncbi:MAG: outer membrane beta-barrel protein [Bacteroidales bacterium]|nr:outer membrane beta-barrel protein [Bacteroidales bacterium]
MKKIILLTIGLLFMLSGAIKAQHDSTIVIDINIDSLTNNIGVNTIQTGINNINKVIENQQLQIDDLYAEIDALGTDPNVDYSDKIDSIEQIIEIKEDFIDDMQDVISDLEDAQEDIADAIDEIGSIDIHVSLPDYDDLYGDLDVDDLSPRKEKKFKGHWAGLNLGVNAFFTSDYSLNLPLDAKFMSVDYTRSREFSINPFQLSIPFFNRYVGAVTGLGFTFNNYELEQNVLLDVDQNGNIVSLNSDISYQKNRFKTASITVPLMLEFQIPVNKKDRRLFVAGGVIGGFNASAKMKSVYTDGNSKIKYKDKSSDWPMTKFYYQATARVGYNDWFLYANYSLMPLFEKNSGPEIYPVTAGVGFRF